MTRVAVLSGTERQPEVRLFFAPSDTHATTGVNLIDWVKKAPRRRWDREARCWVITAFGGRDTTPRDPERMLVRAGFDLDLSPEHLAPSLRDVVSLMDLTSPVCRQSQRKPSIALVRPRFAGWEVCRNILGEAAQWDRETQRFEVPLTELLIHGDAKPGLVIEKATIGAARAALLRTHEFGSDRHDDETLAADAAAVAYSTGLGLTAADEEQVARLAETVGDVPDWFGFDCFPYQRLGAIAACGGRSLMADETGLGKTIQALAVLAIRGSQRAVIIVPPVVLTNWAREAEKAGLGVPAPKRRVPKTSAPGPEPNALGQDRPAHARNPQQAPPRTEDGRQAGDTIVAEEPSPRYLVVFKAGRREPELPEQGIVFVPDSLIASRPELRERIADWDPDALVYDEAHRARNWRSNRAQSVRDLCARLGPDALRLPMTATPLFANPAELASLLAISGHLDPVFGGYSAFVSRYCKRNHFNALVPNLNRLDELKSTLAERVWVRRNKADVLKDLPKVSRNASFVDVDLSGFKKAHDEVIDKICDWLDECLAEHRCYPNDKTVKAYSRQQIGLISPLRKAAGLAKVPVVLDYIADWINDEVQVNADGSISCDRPLLVWAHHHEVVCAIVEHSSKHLRDSAQSMLGVIDGDTSQARTNLYVDQFQAGQLPVLVCSITAAGVGITLTRGSDQVHCETDWTPALVSQAIDRQNRIGQTRPVTVNFLIAAGTLDEHIQRVLAGKAEVVDGVLGSTNAGVHVVSDEGLDDLTGPSEIVRALVKVAIDKHKRRSGKASAA